MSVRKHLTSNDFILLSMSTVIVQVSHADKNMDMAIPNDF